MSPFLANQMLAIFSQQPITLQNSWKILFLFIISHPDSGQGEICPDRSESAALPSQKTKPTINKLHRSQAVTHDYEISSPHLSSRALLYDLPQPPLSPFKRVLLLNKTKMNGLCCSSYFLAILKFIHWWLIKFWCSNTRTEDY